MKIRTYLKPLFLMMFGLAIAVPTALSQEDVILVPGNPPLKQSMVDKTADLLAWALEIRISPERRSMLRDVVIRSWKTNNDDEIKSTLNIVDIHDKLARMAEAERNNVRGQLQAAILENLRKEQSDELSRILVSEYEATHSANSRNSSRSISTPKRTRVGADGFSGIYVGTRNFTSGMNTVQLDYVTFLPDGSVYWTLPAEGLLYFDPQVARRAGPDEWGTYKVVGREVRVTVGNGLSYVFLKEGTSLKLQPHSGSSAIRTYNPLAAADGLKLQGTYRRFEGAPGVTFANDGKFRDEGFTQNFGTMARADGTTYEGDGRGGTGTYMIDQNTLELRYSDGRVKLFAFTVLPENIRQQPVKTFRINYETFRLD